MKLSNIVTITSAYHDSRNGLSLPDTKACEVLKLLTPLLYICMGIIHSSMINCIILVITYHSVSALSNSQIEVTDPLLTNKVL